MDRRTFLAAAPLAVLPAGGRSHPPGPKMSPVIDTHQHLWNLDHLRLGWLKPDNSLARSYTPADYAAATAGLNVTKAVYMEVDVVPEDKQKEADFVIGLCESKKTPTVAAVVGGRPADAGFADYVKQFKGHKVVKGVRQVLQGADTPAGFCLTPAFVKGVQLLGELGLTYDLCGPPTELTNFAKLAAACPGTRFVLDHCGNPSTAFTPGERDAWNSALGRAAALKNVVCKLSGFVANGKPGAAVADIQPYVDAVLGAFGAGRVMFGGDWPVVTRATTYAGWLGLAGESLAGRTDAVRAAVFHDTAAKFYGI